MGRGQCAGDIACKILGYENRDIQGFLFLGMFVTFLVFGLAILYKTYQDHGFSPSWRWVPGVWLLTLAWRDSNAVIGYLHPFGLSVVPRGDYVTTVLAVAFAMSVLACLLWIIRGLDD